TNLVRIWDRFGLLAIVLASWVVFAAFTDGFVSEFNVYSVGRLVSIAVVVGFSQMVVIAIGQMNLSIGAIGGVVAMFLGWLMQGLGIPWPVAIVVAVGFGGLLGAVNGAVIVRTGINAFIVTLGTASVFSGAMFIATKVEAFRDLPPAFLEFGRLKLLGLVSPLVLMMIGALVFLFLLYRGTTLGRQMLATGANARAARVSGVPVGRIVTVTHMLSGALAGLAGVMLVLRIGSAIPSIGTAGGGDWLLPSFAAPAIGGTLLSGGVVNVVGTFIGGLLLGTIENGLTLLSVPGFWVQLITGLVLLFAVILDRARTVAVERSRLGVAA
ncbi:MAG TPA: ABC transporter permease, partial [Vicinamibacterales bacterium]